MLGAVIALLSTLSFSMNAILIRRGVVRASASQGALVTVVLGVPLFLIAAAITGQLFRTGDLSSGDYGLLVAAGLIHFVLGRYLNYRAIAAIGAARTGPVQTLTIPYSILIALIFLDEGLNPLMLVGIVLILAGPPMMVERRRVRQPVAAGVLPDAPGQEMELRQVDGYVSALLGALAYGTSPILIRAALEGEAGLAVLGGLMSYVAAAVAMLIWLGFRGRTELIDTLKPATFRVFAWAGFFVWLAQMLRFLALSMAPVAVVQALQNTGSVFTLVLSWKMNRSLELINLRVVVGIVVSMAGALLLIAARG